MMMNSFVRVFVCALVAGLVATSAPAQITIPTVPIGDADNAPDSRLMTDGTTGYGSVSYPYNIGTHEVTAGQYTAFLNAVARTDTNSLYHPNQARTDWGSGITRSGPSGSYTYSVDPAFVSRPVNFITFWDAVRFANWLHNGQPSGPQNNDTTEDGAYTLTPAGIAADTVTRNSYWRWAVPSENEWYKAAYYRGGSMSAGYWRYPTSSNTAPGRDLADASGNNANWLGPGPYPIQSPYFTTLVGQFANSASPYGTFDQGGNVWEWNEGATGNRRGNRGGSHYYDDLLQADFRVWGPPTLEEFGLGDLGFRVVQAAAGCVAAWEPAEAGQRPSARTSHATAWDSHRGVLVVFGGQTNSGITNETWEWNGSSWSLRSTSGPSPRVHSVASYDPVRQRTVLFGGRASGSTMFDETWEWDGSAWTLRSLPSRPSARSVAGMVFDSLRGRMVLFGGINSSFTQLGDTWEYDGSTWVLRATGGPSPREWPGMAYDSARQKTVLAGGTTSSGTSLSDTWEWDGSVGTWTFRNIPGPPPRGNKNLAYDAARGVVVLYSSYGNNTFWADHWEYDGAAWIRRTLPGPVARFSHPMVYDPAQQRVLLFGGEVAAGGGNTSWMDDLWEFDGTKWIPMSGSPPIPRFGAPRAFVPELGGAVTFGGAYAIGPQFFAVSNELWLQSPSGWGLLQTNNPTSRAYSALGAIGNGQLLMFGGLVGSNNIPENDLWRFSGTTWTQLYPSNAPFPRSGAASCVFTSTNRFIIFGGQWDGAVLPNTLHTIDTADPQHWVSFATVGPSRREDAMMAYDPVRDEAILCGGRNSSGFDLDDVWRLRFIDGSPEWTPMPSLGSINSWSGGSMFWDPGRQRILLYAKQQFGFDQFAIVEPTVYEWTGTNFVPIQVGDPPSLRRYASMGPTSSSGDIRLFGGLLASDNATILGDTWAFNGVAEPSFPLPPTGAGTFERGDTVTLTLPLVIGQSPSLRWSRDGVELTDGPTPFGSVISGAQTRTLTISNAQAADAGSYLCSATNPCGSSESASALVDIIVPCPSDFNNDGAVDGDDVIGFFAAWDAGELPGDFTQDGSVDGDDVIGFFGAWDSGC